MRPGRIRSKRGISDTSQKSLLRNLRGIVKLFSKGEKAKLSALVMVQIVLSLLDLLGVAIIGIIGALAVRGVQSQAPGDRVSALLEILRIENQTLQIQVTILGVIVAVSLVGRTVISVFLTKNSCIL